MRGQSGGQRQAHAGPGGKLVSVGRRGLELDKGSIHPPSRQGRQDKRGSAFKEKGQTSSTAAVVAGASVATAAGLVSLTGAATSASPLLTAGAAVAATDSSPATGAGSAMVAAGGGTAWLATTVDSGAAAAIVVDRERWGGWEGRRMWEDRRWMGGRARREVWFERVRRE